MTYRFGPFVADRTAYRVSRGEVPLELTPKLLDCCSICSIARPRS